MLRLSILAGGITLLCPFFVGCSFIIGPDLEMFEEDKGCDVDIELADFAGPHGGDGDPIILRTVSPGQEGEARFVTTTVKLAPDVKFTTMRIAIADGLPARELATVDAPHIELFAESNNRNGVYDSPEGATFPDHSWRVQGHCERENNPEAFLGHDGRRFDDLSGGTYAGRGEFAIMIAAYGARGDVETRLVRTQSGDFIPGEPIVGAVRYASNLASTPLEPLLRYMMLRNAVNLGQTYSISATTIASSAGEFQPTVDKTYSREISADELTNAIPCPDGITNFQQESVCCKLSAADLTDFPELGIEDNAYYCGLDVREGIGSEDREPTPPVIKLTR